MNHLDKQYQELLQNILDNGVTKMDRTGTGTVSVFGRQIRHKMSEGFPLITTKKVYWKGIVTELLWFLRGDTNIKYLVDNDCHIWDGDAYKNYLNVVMYEKPDYLHEKYGHLILSVKREGDNYIPYTQEEFINKIKTDDKFAKVWADLGPIYGKQWRSWDSYNFVDDEVHTIKIDQIANSIHLLKTDPDSRRNRVNSWNVGELDQMTLPPCHTDFQFYTRELSLEERCTLANFAPFDDRFPDGDGFKWDEHTINIAEDWLRQHHTNLPTRAISLMWNQRSVDTFLGLPFNIASYGLLLEIIAKEVNMVPDELIGNLGDTHLYLNHIEQAKEQIGRELTKEERKKLYENEFTPNMEVKNDEWLDSKLTTREIPKRTREPYPLPKLDIHPGMLDYELDKLEIDMFKILDYQSHPHIKAPLSN
jgi:thymidylate synthase